MLKLIMRKIISSGIVLLVLPAMLSLSSCYEGEGDLLDPAKGINKQGGGYDGDLYPPYNVSASQGAYSDHIEISWSYVTGAYEYHVYRSNQEYGYYYKLAGTSTYSPYYDNLNDSEVLNSPSPDGKWYYKVKAVGWDNNESNFSAVAMGYKSSIETPKNVNVYQSGNMIVLGWSYSGNTSEFCIEASDNGSNFAEIERVNSTGESSYSVSKSGPPNSMYYYFRIRAYSSLTGLYSSYSEVVSVYYVFLSAPSGVSATDGTYTGYVRISWNYVTGADNYYVYRYTDQPGSNEYYVGETGSEINTIDDSTAAAGTLYYYRVCAYSTSFGIYCDYSIYDAGYAANTVGMSMFVSGTSAGDNQSFTEGTFVFNLKYVPSGLEFKTGTDDSGTASIASPYWIGETEVTYELWDKVYQWAIANGYTFANAGTMGDGSGDTNQHPVTYVNWRDSMVWCNALTEYYNAKNGVESDLGVVYFSNSSYTLVIRDSRDGSYGSSVNTTAGSSDNPYINTTANGFRLPSIEEWSCAARYKGTDSSNGAYEYPVSSGQYWTPGDYASGAIADFYDDGATALVAWYSYNSGFSTNEVRAKNSNALGLYDMSGNVLEWNFNWHPNNVGTYRVKRGGGWDGPAQNMRVGNWIADGPYNKNLDTGFRFARTQ